MVIDSTFHSVVRRLTQRSERISDVPCRHYSTRRLQSLGDVEDAVHSPALPLVIRDQDREDIECHAKGVLGVRTPRFTPSLSSQTSLHPNAYRLNASVVIVFRLWNAISV